MVEETKETTQQIDVADLYPGFPLPITDSGDLQLNQEQNNDQDDLRDKKDADKVATVPFPNMKKKNYSQYDLVKLKVHIQEHFYVFSRFLMSRILTLIRVNEKDAIKITLDIKKHFVES